MAHEIGAVYTIVGADGTTAVLNSPTDPNFVGYIREIGGLDSADVRESSEDIPQGDGAIHGSFYAGRRPVTIEGFIHADGDNASVRNGRVDRLLRATLALRGDSLLKWTESGGVARQLSLRRQQPTRISKLRPKDFLVAMVAADPRIVSQAINSGSVSAGALTTSGFNFPLNFPLDFMEVAGLAGSISATNAGNGEPGGPGALPWFRVDGPITNPRIRNNTTGKEIRIIGSLSSSEYLLIDSRDHTIKLNGSIDRYDLLDFANSEWWELQSGANDVRLLSAAYSAPAALTIYWRDSWL